MQGTGKHINIFVEAGVCLRRTGKTIIPEKEYYAILRAHTIVHSVMLTLH